MYKKIKNASYYIDEIPPSPRPGQLLKYVYVLVSVVILNFSIDRYTSDRAFLRLSHSLGKYIFYVLSATSEITVSVPFSSNTFSFEILI